MNMSEFARLCEIKADELSATHPTLKREKLLEFAAQNLGFKHFTSLEDLLELLGPEGVPSEVEILMAGGDPRDTPFQSVGSTVSSGWSEAGSANT
ncbi:hypothetical protein D3C72_1111840 [compost metagenome]